MKLIPQLPLLLPYRCFVTKGPRVRFAPSPTGYLHLGGLRTALYNKLYAKSLGGSLILRIEDTDQTRKVEGSIEALIADLEWSGIHCDEGPGIGGHRGPYIQSERLHIYQEYIKKLLENGSAYRCYCTERRLSLLRRDAVKSHSIPRYDNRCRSLSKEEITRKMKTGASYCIRFRLTPECQYFDDLVFGGIGYDVSINEGDPVLMKSDGFPTYHFANVVDDYLMEVTHVLRGVEWQISTTKHLLIYMAFGWKPPVFGHLPLIVNADGTKLSKRQKDVKVEDYKQNGIFPLALVNYISLAGGGFNHVPGAGIRLKSMNELAQEIRNVSPHPSRLNPDLLNECNKLEIKRRLLDENLSKDLVTRLQQLVRENYPQENINVSPGHVRDVLEWSTARISTLEELVTKKYAFLWILPTRVDQTEITQDQLLGLLLDLESLTTFEQPNLKQCFKEFSLKNNIKFPVLMKVLRSALSGLAEGPGVAEMMHLLGKHQSLTRIKSMIT